MFKEDQKICQEWAADDPKVFVNTIMFVSISIRVQTHQLPSMMRQFTMGQEDPVLFGFKHATRKFVRENQETLFDQYHQWLLSKRWKGRTEREQATEAMLFCLRIPGIGTAKAGFLSSLLTGRAWCADVNNLAWFGVDDRQFYINPSTPFVNRCVRVDRYLALGERLGGTGFLWDNWCQKISEKYPKAFPMAQDVSNLHWQVHEGLREVA